MKRSILVAVLPFVFATSAFALDTPQSPSSEPVEYRYGMELDIKRVISLTDTSSEQGVVPATLTYEDSQGHVNTVSFREAGGVGRAG